MLEIGKYYYALNPGSPQCSYYKVVSKVLNSHGGVCGYNILTVDESGNPLRGTAFYIGKIFETLVFPYFCKERKSKPRHPLTSIFEE